MAKLGLRMNMQNKALTQYMNWEFDSAAMVHGMPIGIGEDGIFQLWTGDSDDGQEIEARMDLPETDLGTSLNKRLRSIFLGCRADGDLRIRIVDDEEAQAVYNLTPFKDGKQHVLKIYAGRKYNKGCYYTFSLENVDGADFSIDFIDILPILLNRRPGGF